MQTKVHSLGVDSGHVVREGKSYWPDCVEVTIPRDIALNVVAQLTSFLQTREGDEVKLSLMGKLDCNTDDFE